MDIFITSSRNGYKIVPHSVHGVLWLQTHFEDTEWDKILSGNAVIPDSSSDCLIEDASQAGLVIKFCSTISKKYR